MSGENENASLPQLQEMAEGIAEYAVAATHVYAMMRSDPEYLQRLKEREESKKHEMMPQITEQLAPLYAELEMMARYETELERAASLLQGLISIGQVKAIGLLEVAAGVERLGQEKAEDIDRLTKLLVECRDHVNGGVHDYMNSVPEREECRDLLTRIDQLTAKGAAQC